MMVLRLFVVVFAFSAIVRAATHYVVPTNTAAADPYTNWATAGTNIIDVVNAAMSNTHSRQVWVSNGVYRLTNEILLTNAVTIQSVNGKDVTIVNGNYPAVTNRCFEINDSNAIIDGFAITNGYLVGSNGGGIYLANGIVRNCLISGNIVSNNGTATNKGGGVYVSAGLISNCMVIGNVVTSPAASSVHNDGGGICITGGIIYGCTVNYNRASWGGGIAGYTYANIRACILSSNTASYGGGIYSSSLTISNCVINGNAAASYGGGLCVAYGTVDGCTIDGNRCGSGYAGGIILNNNSILRNSVIKRNISSSSLGGGGVVFSGGGRMYACLIAGNMATNAASGGGGGIYIEVIKNNAGWIGSCTIASNTVTKGAGGGGVFLYDTNNDFAVSNCVIYGNTATNANYNDVCTTNMLANSNAFNYCCFSDPSRVFSGTGNITNNPLFVDFSGGNYRLGAGSPCVNAGTNQSWMTNAVDLDGRMRIRYGVVDMGAYETIYEGTMYKIGF